MVWAIVMAILISNNPTSKDTVKTKEYVFKVRIQQPVSVPLDTVKSYRITTELISLLRRNTIWVEAERFTPKLGGLYVSFWTYHMDLEDDTESVRIFAPGIGIRRYGNRMLGSLWAPYFGAGIDLITYKYQHHPTKVNIAPTINFGQASAFGNFFVLAGGIIRAEFVGKLVFWDFLLTLQGGLRFH